MIQFALLSFCIEGLQHVVGIDVEHMRVGSLFREQYVVGLGQVVLFYKLGYITVRVVEVTENTGAALAGVDTGGFHPVIDAMRAHIAFVSGLLSWVATCFDKGVERSHTVWAGIDTLAATDTLFFVYQDHAVRTLIGRALAVTNCFTIGGLELGPFARELGTCLDARRHTIFLIALAVIAHQG